MFTGAPSKPTVGLGGDFDFCTTLSNRSTENISPVRASARTVIPSEGAGPSRASPTVSHTQYERPCVSVPGHRTAMHRRTDEMKLMY